MAGNKGSGDDDSFAKQILGMGGMIGGCMLGVTLAGGVYASGPLLWISGLGGAFVGGMVGYFLGGGRMDGK